MKRLFFTITAFFLIVLSAYSQEKQNFTFVKSSIARLEKYATYSDDQIVSTPELKKRMQGLFLIDTPESKVDFNSNKYIKFSSIPSTEKFVMITDAEYGNRNSENNLIIQNVKTKQFYAVINYAIRSYQDHTNMGNTANGNGWLTKYVPKEIPQSEKDLLARYKALIKSANANTYILSNIQKKHITKGYFDSSKVNATDRKLYNKNLIELKAKASKLRDIDLYEDKNDNAQSKLTTQESISLTQINEWNFYQKI